MQISKQIHASRTGSRVRGDGSLPAGGGGVGTCPLGGEPPGGALIPFTPFAVRQKNEGSYIGRTLAFAMH